jgi:hypothetical protein
MSNFLTHFNALQNNTIFCMWTGTNPMSAQRINALWSIFNHTRCPVVFINNESYKEWIRPEVPLHPAFEYLSETHKSDYLRCYLMHHYGGGYTDLKLTYKSWIPLFEQLRQNEALALGYEEIAQGIPHVTGSLGDEIRIHHKELIGLCAFIFKKNTPLTTQWLNLTHLVLDEHIELLRKHPAKHPQDQYGVILNNMPSPYPLRWAQILGEIFHPLTYANKHCLMQGNIAPIFHSYR